jgi:transposase
MELKSHELDGDYMVTKELLQEFLQLEDLWEPAGVQYCQSSSTLIVTVKEMNALWSRHACPHCKSRHIALASHGKKRTWRHLDGFNAKTMIECALPSGKCSECERVFQVQPRWVGRSRHFTRAFEAFALSMIRETSIKNASRILCESDQRLWRMLFTYIEGLPGELSTIATSILHREWSRTKR